MNPVKIAVAGGLCVAAVALGACSSTAGSTSSSSPTRATAPSTSMSSAMSTSMSSAMSSSMSSAVSSSSGAASTAAPSGATDDTATVRGDAITLDVTDALRFMPSTIHVPRAGTVTVTLKDTGSYPHDISVPSLHTTSASVSGTPGEQTTSVRLDFPKAGTYPFICTYHSEAGMRGVFIVG